MTSIQALMDSYQERRRTGVIRFSYAMDKQLFFIFKKGAALSSYLVMPERWEFQTSEQSMAWALAAGDAYAQSAALSPFGVLMTKISIEARGEEALTVERADLQEYLRRVESEMQPTLLRLNWKNAAAAVFFAPNASPRVQLFAQDVLVSGADSLKVLLDWDESSCVAQAFTPDLTVSAWQEYFLRSAFADIFMSLLKRFEILTGRALIDSMARMLSTFSAYKKLNITATARSLEDDEFFASPQECAQQYNALLSEIFTRFSAVIGPRLHEITVREIVSRLSPLERQAAQDFHLLPEGYVNE